MLPKYVAILTLAALALWFGRLAQAPVSGGPRSIVRLELAPTVAAANRFFDAWRKEDRWRERLNEAQRWDTWLICAYAPLFALLSWLTADYFVSRCTVLALFGRALAGTQLLAGALDFLENAAIQKMLDRGHAYSPWPQVSSTASGLKWMLLALFAAYLLATALYWLWSLVRSH